jgi:hypothetical protein
VFPTTIGTPPDAQNIVNRHFKPLLRRAGLPDIRWHDLRHTCATLLLSRGTHPKYVQQLLGHASIQLTLDRYSHWMPSMGKHTASAMDDALEDSDDAPNTGERSHLEPHYALVYYWCTGSQRRAPASRRGFKFYGCLQAKIKSRRADSNRLPAHYV